MDKVKIEIICRNEKHYGWYVIVDGKEYGQITGPSESTAKYKAEQFAISIGKVAVFD